MNYEVNGAKPTAGKDRSLRLNKEAAAVCNYWERSDNCLIITS